MDEEPIDIIMEFIGIMTMYITLLEAEYLPFLTEIWKFSNVLEKQNTLNTTRNIGYSAGEIIVSFSYLFNILSFKKRYLVYNVYLLCQSYFVCFLNSVCICTLLYVLIKHQCQCNVILCDCHTTFVQGRKLASYKTRLNPTFSS